MVSALWGLACSGLTGPPPEAKPGLGSFTPSWTGMDLSDRVEGFRAEGGVPGMAVGVVRGDQLIAAGAAGERIVDSGVPVTVHDQWHLGSNTKSMTATVAASMVEEGVIRWETTVAEVFPGAEATWAQVSLADLLHHRGGAPDLGLQQLLGWRMTGDSPRAIRADWVASVTASPPADDRGQFRYCNGGYVIAGAMLEAVADQDWEVLVTERVFVPLGMERSGFGPVPLPHNPSGHATFLEAHTPTGDSDWSDNPAAMGPAGTVHSTLQDWAAYVAAHKAVLMGQPGPFEGEAYAWLHRPPPIADEDDEERDYAAGWIVFGEREWARGPAYGHNGSNGSWYAVMAIAPARDLALLCTVNTLDGGRSEPLCLDAFEALADDEDVVGPDPAPQDLEDVDAPVDEPDPQP